MTLSKKIWIDLDNSPHVLFFKPIINALKSNGFEIITTARRAFQVIDLLKSHEINAKIIGRHHGKIKFIKFLGLFLRAFELYSLIRKEKPILAISHGSRAQMILARLLNIKSILLLDYEHVKLIPFTYPYYIFVPEIVNGDNLKSKCVKLIKYPGIKEDAYVPCFKPDPSIISKLGIRDNANILITVRPPATEAHYHNPESTRLFELTMSYLMNYKQNLTIIVLARNEKQAAKIEKEFKKYNNKNDIIIPAGAINGLNLIWHSDLVISGGGTMNREAAALGVPVYSIFRGKLGAVDRYLSEQNRLILIENEDDIKTKIRIIRRNKSENLIHNDKKTLDYLIQYISHIYKDL